jgi:hypothetical protein
MANSCNNSDAELAPFLRELADSVESDNMPPDQLKFIGEFLMSYKFHERRNGWKQTEDTEEEDFDVIKFITMGWWIYTQILKNEKDTTYSSGFTGPVDPINSTD